MSDQFWNHLLATASAIDGLATSGEDRLAEIGAQMESIEVLYQRAFDPADAYAEYVAVTLCRAINNALPRS